MIYRDVIEGLPEERLFPDAHKIQLKLENEGVDQSFARLAGAARAGELMEELRTAWQGVADYLESSSKATRPS